jgi:hypothetical protein
MTIQELTKRELDGLRMLFEQCMEDFVHPEAPHNEQGIHIIWNIPCAYAMLRRLADGSTTIADEWQREDRCALVDSMLEDLEKELT